MANIKRIDGKSGISFKITVAHGRDMNGKQIRHYKTWTPVPGMTERKMEREVQKIALEFEQSIELGFQADNRQTFAEYATYVLDLKLRNEKLKIRTYDRYVALLERINQGIGHMKMNEIRPQHLNRFYQNLAENGVRKGTGKAVAKVDLLALLKKQKQSRQSVATSANIARSTVSQAINGSPVEIPIAKAICKALHTPLEHVFQITRDERGLSNKTILEHHRLISSILAQAEKEMLVAYNAAEKATPPTVKHQDPNYFQPEEIAAILDALEAEPIKWRTLTHLLIVTGCRRGEIAGLKWDKVDLEEGRIKIDRALLITPSKGVYEDTTKTEDTRFLRIPAETVQLLKQYRAYQWELQLKNGDRWQNSGYVFTTDDGSCMRPDTITAWLSDFSKRRDLPHINPHAFRHTVASVLIANGTDVVTVSKQLGHANVNTTESFYSHIIEESKAQAAECLADVMLRRKQA